jgi:hypothetical protein
MPTRDKLINGVVEAVQVFQRGLKQNNVNRETRGIGNFYNAVSFIQFLFLDDNSDHSNKHFDGHWNRCIWYCVDHHLKSVGVKSAKTTGTSFLFGAASFILFYRFDSGHNSFGGAHMWEMHN